MARSYRFLQGPSAPAVVLDRPAQLPRQDFNAQTTASIAAAKRAQQQERAAVEAATGLRILDCGRIVRPIAPWGLGQGFNDDAVLAGLDAALRVGAQFTERD